MKNFDNDDSPKTNNGKPDTDTKNDTQDNNDDTDNGENFEGDGLPNIEISKPLPFENDIIVCDDAETITMSQSDKEKLEPDDTPFYTNQEEDPEVQNLLWAEWADDE